METYGTYGYAMFIMATRNVVKYVCFFRRSHYHIKQTLNHGGYVNQQVSVWAINKDAKNKKGILQNDAGGVK